MTFVPIFIQHKTTISNHKKHTNYYLYTVDKLFFTFTSSTINDLYTTGKDLSGLRLKAIQANEPRYCMLPMSEIKWKLHMAPNVFRTYKQKMEHV